MSFDPSLKLHLLTISGFKLITIVVPRFAKPRFGRRRYDLVERTPKLDPAPRVQSCGRLHRV